MTFCDILRQFTMLSFDEIAIMISYRFDGWFREECQKTIQLPDMQRIQTRSIHLAGYEKFEAYIWIHGNHIMQQSIERGVEVGKSNYPRNEDGVNSITADINQHYVAILQDD